MKKEFVQRMIMLLLIVGLAGFSNDTAMKPVKAAQSELEISYPTEDALPEEKVQVEILSADQVDETELIDEYSAEQESTATTIQDAEKALREAVLNRETTVTISLSGDALEGVTSDTITDHAKSIVQSMSKHITCGEAGSNSKLGDYYEKTRGGYRASISYRYYGTDIISATYTYTFNYYTDKSQEDYVDDTLENEVYPKLQVSDASLTDAQKICKIYSWMTNNISYDYENLNDSTNYTKYTAYGALYEGKAVCQGFATLFYRICMDNGIDCRIVTGTANGGGHAWNIVKVDNLYYYIDATWDCKVIADGTRSEKAATYFYFLRSSLEDHVEDSSKNITGGYAMAGESISAIAADVETEGSTSLSTKNVTLRDICGNVLTQEQAIWYRIILSRDSSTACKWNLVVRCNAVGKENLIFVEETIYMHKDSDGDGKCDVCEQFKDGVGTRLAGYSLSLADQIGVNFYMELSDDIKASKTAYMLFTLPNGEQSRVYVNGTHEDGKTATTKQLDENGTTYYIFTCEVAAKEMTDDVKAQIIDEDKAGTEYTYTVKEYADYILEHPKDSAGDGFDEDTVKLVKAMLNYGGSAQQYFEYHTDKLASDGLDVSDITASLTKDWMNDQAYKTIVSGDTDVCTFESAYLSLMSTVDLNVYVKLADGVEENTTSFYLDQKQIIPVKQTIGGQEYYKLTLTGIKANELSLMHTFQVVTEDKEATLSYGAFSYARTVFSDACKDVTGITSLREVMNGLYLYNLYSIVRNTKGVTGIAG